MPASLVALQILLILLPGFASAAIIESLAIRGKLSDFQRVIGACLNSFLIYASFVLITCGALPFAVEGQGTANPFVLWSARKLAVLFCCTVGFSLLASVYINLDGNRLLRRFRLTQRTTRYSIWNDIFERVATSDQVVQVELDGNRSVIGVLTYYSDEADDCSLFVSQAAWVDESGDTTEIPGSGILITKNAGIRTVSLLKKS